MATTTAMQEVKEKSTAEMKEDHGNGKAFHFASISWFINVSFSILVPANL